MSKDKSRTFVSLQKILPHPQLDLSQEIELPRNYPGPSMLNLLLILNSNILHGFALK